MLYNHYYLFAFAHLMSYNPDGVLEPLKPNVACLPHEKEGQDAQINTHTHTHTHTHIMDRNLTEFSYMYLHGYPQSHVCYKLQSKYQMPH
jgi:hypothetical protein